jgi:pSer/pThr/pTyr-binding forkhead associated (FHA) protein
MPAQLIALPDGLRILVDKPILLLGRDAECDIQIDSRKVSRRHCCIAQVGEELVVRDLGSTNGIRINGVRVLEGRLKAGDELAIGNHRYQVRWDTMPPGSEKAVARRVKEKTAKAVEDELLESSEEPVPLGDGGEVKPKRPPASQADSTPKPGPNEKSPSPDLDAPIPGLLPDEYQSKPSGPNVVPDQIKLAPATDDIPFVSPRKLPPKP